MMNWLWSFHTNRLATLVSPVAAFGSVKKGWPSVLPVKATVT